MLQGEFFKIISSEIFPEDPVTPGIGQFVITIELNPDHPIYEGHFPGNPVVPGVCQVQMVREGLETLKNIKGTLRSAGNIKFLNVIVPSEHPTLTVRYKVKSPHPENINFSAIISSGSTTFLKFNGVLCTRPF
jgi:3-hydroxyacyl-[acyl-carrier-protein] dehydratase